MNLSIKTKLLAGFSICLILLIAVAGYMLYKFSEANEQLHQVIDSSSRKMDISYMVLENVLEMGIMEQSILLKGKTDNSWAVFIKKREEVENKTEQLEALVDENGRELLNEFKADWETYLLVLDSKIPSNENILNIGEIDFDELTELRNNAVVDLEQLVAKNRLEMQDEYLISESNFNNTLISIVLIVSLSILITIIFSYWIISSINRRIGNIAGKAEKIASREYSHERLEQTINDELNPIVRSLVSINDSFREVTDNANKIATGDYEIEIEPRSKRDILGISLQQMAFSLKSSEIAKKRHNWLSSGLNKLNDRLMGNRDVQELCDQIISFLAVYLESPVGAVYLFDQEKNILELSGHYGYPDEKSLKKTFRLKEGLIGQAAFEQKEILLTEVNTNDLRIISSSFETLPNTVLIIPFTYQEKILGVLEIGKHKPFKDQEKVFLDSAIENISLAVQSAIARTKIQELLRETQIQSEELQTQQEELRQMNEELEEQTQNLKQQQEELQMTNEELEEQTQALEAKNKEIESAKTDVEQKTEQLEITSKYKSEFLANMSHELRTPLNSLLLLSRDLSENKKKNLDEEQLESAEIIYKSGQDLLILINEVLDLSRVEAGKMNLHVERVRLSGIIDEMFKLFRYEANQKGLDLRLVVDENLPEYIKTDPQRLNQVLKNLLSNAIKFTEQGSVSFEILKSGDYLEFLIKDTGIGIKKEKQKAVFEAFQQADGGTARKYGGTGLGLSISREITKLLGGEITLESVPAQGSTFKVQIPVNLESPFNHSTPLPEQVSENPVISKEFLNFPTIEDDKDQIEAGDKKVLIIEDDLHFLRILKRQANQKNFKVIAASTGEDGLRLIDIYKPDAIILDIDLPGINGHQVLSEIKLNPRHRHIPVHMVSVDERTLDPIRHGAVEYLRKPVAKSDLERAFSRIEDFVNRKMKNLLIVEDDKNSRIAIKKLIGNGDVHCLEAESGAIALEKIAHNSIDCIVLDMGLPDMNGFDFIRELEGTGKKVPPIIIYTGKELTKEENEILERYADSIIIKGVKSEERLLDETALFLHRTITNLPEKKREIITNLYDKASIFNGKQILIVDDDMRNVFALSKVLKQKGMEVIKADNGVTALKALTQNPNIDLVLMDIMMPEMDGYEAMQKIREQFEFKLPIIALTAKAMRDDKQKCIDAGANDYISKPVDINRLLSLMQVWLSS